MSAPTAIESPNPASNRFRRCPPGRGYTYFLPSLTYRDLWSRPWLRTRLHWVPTQSQVASSSVPLRWHRFLSRRQ